MKICRETRCKSEELNEADLTAFPQPLSPGNSFEGKYGWNRLAQVRNGTTVVAGYAYDGASRRVSKTMGTLVRHYYYSDQWQVLEERLSTTGTERKYLWGIRSVDDLIWRERVEGSGPGSSSSSSSSGPGLETLYALSDAMGSVTAITDMAGNVLERYGYDGFGSVRYMTGTFVARTGSSYTWETLFDGYRYDAESGLYQVRYRYLHPKLGRWISRDPLEHLLPRKHQVTSTILKDGFSLYAFVQNDPIGTSDSTGEAISIAIGAEVGTAICPGAGTVIGGIIGGIITGVGIYILSSSPHDSEAQKKEKERVARCNAIWIAQDKVCEQYYTKAARAKCYKDNDEELEKCLRNRGGKYN